MGSAPFRFSPIFPVDRSNLFAEQKGAETFKSEMQMSLTRLITPRQPFAGWHISGSRSKSVMADDELL